jgi:DNA-binding MarR family transcriptional regulator
VRPEANWHYRFGDLLAVARLSWVRQIRARLEESGFAGYRRTDAGMLRVLGRRPSAIGQLGEAMGITRQAARQLADGMVERGYASFAADPADARRTLVVLTGEGKDYARAVWEAEGALNNAVGGRVAEADLLAADRVLRAVFGEGEARRQLDHRMPPPGPLADARLR